MLSKRTLTYWKDHLYVAVVNEVLHKAIPPLKLGDDVLMIYTKGDGPEGIIFTNGASHWFGDIRDILADKIKPAPLGPEFAAVIKEIVESWCEEFHVIYNGRKLKAADAYGEMVLANRRKQ